MPEHHLRRATVHAPTGIVASADHLASSAGVAALRAGGTAADAAVTAAAVLAVTSQQACGIGGDLWAVVHSPGEEPVALCAAGRAGSGADPAQLRSEGHVRVPLYDDIRAVTLPGCVDGWIELHHRFGRLPLAQVLEPARSYAATGFPASTLLTATVGDIIDRPGAESYRVAATPTGGRLRAGAVVRLPGLAWVLDELAQSGRVGVYRGEFGDGLRRLAPDLFDADDLDRPNAEWVRPLRVRAWGHDVWTTPPPSQGYLTLSGAWVAERLDLPAEPDDPSWPHLLSEVARLVGWDRPDVLHEDANGDALLDGDRLASRLAAIDPERRSDIGSPSPVGGDTTYLAVVDRDRTAVSLIQSNASTWGSHIVEPTTGVVLHNRGLGFSLIPGHPAELAPGRRPPHTLSPTVVTRPDGSLRSVLGTMGGDSQPQVLLQLLARLLLHGTSPGAAVAAPRWVLVGGGRRFDTWDDPGPRLLAVEADAPWGWDGGLRQRGHDVQRSEALIDPRFGHAQVIDVGEDGVLHGAADPRTVDGAAIGY